MTTDSNLLDTSTGSSIQSLSIHSLVELFSLSSCYWNLVNCVFFFMCNVHMFGVKQTACGLLLLLGFSHFRGAYFMWSQQAANKHSQVCTLMSMTNWLKLKVVCFSLVHKIKFINKHQDRQVIFFLINTPNSSSCPVAYGVRSKFAHPGFPPTFCFLHDEPWEKRDGFYSLQSSWTGKCGRDLDFGSLPTAVHERSPDSFTEGRGNVDWNRESGRNQAEMRLGKIK